MSRQRVLEDGNSHVCFQKNNASSFRIKDDTVKKRLGWSPRECDNNEPQSPRGRGSAMTCDQQVLHVTSHTHGHIRRVHTHTLTRYIELCPYLRDYYVLFKFATIYYN